MSSPSNPADDGEAQPSLAPDAIFTAGGAPLPSAPRPATALDPPWTGWDVLRIVLIATLAMVFFGYLAIEAARSLLGTRDVAAIARDPRVIVPAQAAAYLVVVLFMYGLVARGYGRPFWGAVRWNFPHQRWIAFLAGGVVLATAVQLGSSFLPVPKQLPIDEYFRNATDAWLMALFGSLLAPVVEELFFRGFLYPVLRRRIGIVAGVAITSLLFALIHESQLGQAWAPLLMLFCVGVVLTIAREVADSVACSVLLHMAYNGTLFAMVWKATDHFRHLEKISQ
jgi:CAAX protease family protein